MTPMISEINQLRADVEALATPAGRIVGTTGHAAARRFLLDRFASLGLTPFRRGDFDLPYEMLHQRFHNLVGIVPGRDWRKPPILVGAHYDSVIQAPCADDNAAAVAIGLSLAEELLRKNPGRDTLIALFDAEEPPFYLSPAMGSIRFFQDHGDSRGFHAALIMDLVGHDVPMPLPAFQDVFPNFGKLLFVTGAESHPALGPIVRRNAVDPELLLVATQNRLVGDLSDHHIFRTQGVPYLFFSCGRWEHYHNFSDTPGRLNYHKMLRIRNLLLGLIEGLAAVDLLRASEADTTELEIDLLRTAFGPGLEFLLDLIGMPQLQTRQDLDSLSMRLQDMFRLK